MKRDFSAVLKDLEGKALVSNDAPFTLKDACVTALMAGYDDERHLSGEQKFARYQLASKISGPAALAEVTAEDIGLLKTLIGKLYSPVVVGPAYVALETDYEMRA